MTVVLQSRQPTYVRLLDVGPTCEVDLGVVHVTTDGEYAKVRKFGIKVCCGSGRALAFADKPLPLQNLQKFPLRLRFTSLAPKQLSVFADEDLRAALAVVRALARRQRAAFSHSPSSLRVQIDLKAQQQGTVFLACKPRMVPGASHFPFSAGLRISILDAEQGTAELLGQITVCVRAAVVQSAVEVRVPESPSSTLVERARADDVVDLGCQQRTDRPCNSWFLLRNLTENLTLRLSLAPSSGVEMAGRGLHCALQPRGAKGDTSRIAFSTVRASPTRVLG
jgi:hypothetical protein